MKKENVEIRPPGIKHTLHKFDYLSAIAEFMWNGFDAEAKTVDIRFQQNEFGGITEIWVTDDGTGILREQVDEKFKPFLQTSREIHPGAKYHQSSAIHAKNGYGRLTFFHFANQAEWITTYRSGTGQLQTFTIKVDEASLNTYEATEEQATSSETTGTKVKFINIKDLTIYDFEKIERYLAKEFAWFLELRSPFSREIHINGNPINYDFLIGDQDRFETQIGEHSFSGRYVRWDDRLHDEYSRYYFSGSDQRERSKRHTTFNNKGDGFFHSFYVVSSYFDAFENQVNEDDVENDAGQLQLFDTLGHDDVFKDLIKRLEEFLRRKRSPFLRKRALKFVNELESEGVFPKFGPEPWDGQRKQDLSGVIRELYEVEPRIFNGLNLQQKQTIVRLFNLVIDSSERDHLLDVLAEVVNLSKKDRADFADILKSARLSNLITTIKLIQDRFTAVDELKKMVFDPSFHANERDHLQTHIERHFWLFGEQYHLVTAAEPDFEAALRRYTYLLNGELKNQKIDHPDKNKEMDIFAVRQIGDHRTKEINNIVAELKHPEITIGQKEFQQVKTYMSVLLEQPEFNGTNMTWDFYLVGKNFDKSIDREIENAKSHGERHLAYKVDNWKIYILRWSEVIASFTLRHDFILEKLKLEREKLVTRTQSADAIIANGHHNSAALSLATNPIATGTLVEHAT